MTDLDEVIRGVIWDHARYETDPCSGTWDAVLARSAVVRKRKRVRHGLAGTLIVALVATIASRVPGGAQRPSDVHEIEATQPQLAPLYADCDSEDVSTRDPLPTHEVDRLRYLPTVLPEGDSIAETSARWQSRCPTPDDVDPILVATSFGSGGVLNGVMRLHGPFSSLPPVPEGEVGTETSQVNLQGNRAYVDLVGGEPSALRLRWSDGEARAWVLTSSGIDREDLLVAADHLEISADPTDSAIASIRQSFLPDDFEITYNTSDAPEQPDLSVREWTVTTVGGCTARFSKDSNAAPLSATVGLAGDIAVDVPGAGPGWFHADNQLTWEVTAEVVGHLDCTMSSDDLDLSGFIDIAKSVSLVGPEDSRLRPDAALGEGA